ncbi:podocalyxin isoform X2 [Pteropus vampyrus]|uniref:Podocalyxin n=1 Tax=Pteropus vampyrus TaxID=132908 RepID=A0A6P6CBD4_PTEVA|nr:podocalyxin isoform X2 [Pteropus vampyrus]
MQLELHLRNTSHVPSEDTVASVENHSDSLSTGEQADPATTKQSIVTASETVSANPKMAPSDSEKSGTPATDKNIAIATGSKNTQDPAQESVTPTTVLMKTETKSSQDGLKTAPGTEVQSSTSVPASVTTQGGRTDLRSTQHLRSPTDDSPALSSLTTPASTQQLTPGSPKGPDQMTTASSSSGTTAGYTFTPSHPGTATTLRSLITSRDLPTSTKMPAITGNYSSTPGTPSSIPGIATSLSNTLQPTSSSGPVATSSGRTTSFRTQLAPTAPQDSNISTPPSVLEDDRITCTKTDRSLNESMLILNLTKTVHCAGSPLDDKLVTLLCRAAKSALNPTQDQCHIQLIVSSEGQAVAVEEITIRTKLFLKDVYESLKDKWDDLKEMGVNDMKLEGQGPPDETEDRFSTPLIITIVCMASFLLLVAALYGCCHQRLSQRKDQQRLTEELQTVENGYHDNPTLEVMETSSEMQEKKVVNLNGELGDSWIVPLDNLTKDDLDEEEDTHL